MARYLYGDYHIPLPELPAEWNQIAYPNLVMVTGNDIENEANLFTVWLVCSGEEYTALKVDGTDVVGIKPYTVVQWFQYYIGGELAWDYKGSLTIEDFTEADTYAEGNVLYYYFKPSKVKWIWCNEDIKNSSNQVIFEGSDPILVEDDPEPEVTETRDLRTYCLGIALELMKKALPISKKIPKFLYGHIAKEGDTPTHTINGVDYVGEVLPALPEWDRKTYPYAAIGRGWPLATTYLLLVSTVPFARKVESNGIEYTMTSVEGSTGLSCRLYTQHDTEVLNEWIIREITYTNQVVNQGFWSNHDILKEDGTVYLAASEPIPVYE